MYIVVQYNIVFLLWLSGWNYRWARVWTKQIGWKVGQEKKTKKQAKWRKAESQTLN